MNLDDFSYEENGRRYINPQVALDEENAFIQNLRDTQGQRNAQIAQQTNGLGKNVPTNLGSLNGSEAYFNARYQTPQTNSLIGDLRAAAQATALNTALNNELTKANKRYKDAYYAAKDRERAATGTGGKTLTNNQLKKELGITSPGAKQETFKQNDTDKGGRGRIDHVTDTPKLSYENKVSIYTDYDGNIYRISDIAGPVAAESLPFTRSVAPSTINPETGKEFQSGDIFTYNGRKYLYLNNEQTLKQPSFYVVESYQGRDDDENWRNHN